VKLVADRVTLAYEKGRSVVRDVSLSVASGRIVAVTGASGAGKTTLLSALAGLMRPAAGEVTIDGVQIRSRDHAVEQRVVLIPQNNGLASVLTAFENIQVALLSAGAPVNDARRLSAEALAALGLEGQAEQLVEELSGGQQQRAAIARGLALRGNVIIADEITSELDAANRQNVLRLLRAEADRGAAVVFATHDPQAAAVCDEELHLIDGFAVIPGTAR
jgi:putative ABC transport system ATP-binding protein